MTENLNHSYLNQSGLERYTEKLKDYLKDNYISKEDEIVAHDLTQFDSIEKEYTFVSKIANDGEEFRDNSAEITKIKGNTLIYNQLLKHINRQDEKNGLVFEQDGNGRVSVKGTATMDTAIDIGQAQLKTGHVYAFYGIDSEKSSFIPDAIHWGDQAQGSDTGSGSISTISYPNENRFCVLYVKAGVELDYYFYPKVTDLTQMFGVGNEPATMEEFYNNIEFIHISSDYNPGQFINGNYNGILSISPESTKESPIESFYDLKTNDLYEGGMKSIIGTDIKDEINFTESVAYDRINSKKLNDLSVIISHPTEEYPSGILTCSGLEGNTNDYNCDKYEVVEQLTENGIYLDGDNNLNIIDTNITDLNTLVKGGIPDNEIWYVTRGNRKVKFTTSFAAGGATNGNLIDNVYSNGFGRMIFDVPVTTISNRMGVDTNDYDEIIQIILPKTITEIGDYAFESMVLLENINIPEGVTRIGECAFRLCGALERIILPESITEIGNMAFHSMSSLEIINIPQNLIGISHDMFYDCKKLIFVDLPATTKYIGAYAFKGCKELTSITIPETVEEIQQEAFCWCDNLTDVYCYPSTPPARILNASVIEEKKSEGDSNIEPLDETAHSDVVKIFEDSGDTKVNIWVPYESVDLYKEAWSDYADQIFPGFNIPTGNTIYYRSIDNQMIDIVDHVDVDNEDGTQKSVSVFGGAKIINHTYEDGLGKLEFDSDVQEIGYGDDAGDIWIAGTYIKAGFKQNENIVDIVLPPTVNTLKEEAFEGCHNLKNVIFNQFDINVNDHYVLNIHGNTFAGCSELYNFCSNNKKSTTIINMTSGAMYGGIGLLGYIKHLNTNKMYGFYDTYIPLSPGNNSSIFGWSALKYVKINYELVGDITNGGAIRTYRGWFYDCKGLKYVDLPFVDSIGKTLYIPENTFKSCTSLKYVNNLNNGNKIAYIGQCAFAECPIYDDLIFDSFHDEAYGDIIPDVAINAFSIPSAAPEAKDLTFNRIVLEVDPNTFIGSNAMASYYETQYPSIYIKCNEAFKMDSLNSSFYKHLYIPKNLYEEFKALTASSDWRKNIKTWDQYSDLLPSLIKIDGSIQYAKKEEEKKDITDITEFPFIKTWVGGEELLQTNNGNSIQSAPIVMSMIYNYRAKSRLDKISKFIATPIAPKVVDHILSECLSTSYNGSGPGWNGLFGDFED